MIKKKYKFISLLIFLILFLIILTDFILSNTFLKNEHCNQYYEYYYELKKNCSGRYRFKNSFPLSNIYTDEMGLRVGKAKIKKDKNKNNIFIFGDSFTYGVGLNYEDTYVGLLEKNLKENYNVYNFAVGSYSPSVHTYKLKETLNKNLTPNKVIIFLDLTDVFDEASRWNYDSENNQIKLNYNLIFQRNLIDEQKFKENNFKLLVNFFSYLNYYSRLARDKLNNKFFEEYKVKQSNQGSFTYTSKKNLNRDFWGNNLFEKGLNKLKARFDELTKISLANNFELFVVIYPWAETLEFGQSEFDWQNFAKELCVENKCQVIDLFPKFQKYKNQNKYWNNELYFLHDEHFNAKGDFLVFEELLKYFKNEKKFK